MDHDHKPQRDDFRWNHQDQVWLTTKAPIHYLTQSCDSISRYGKPMERNNKTDFIGLLHWFPAATGLIAILSQKSGSGPFTTWRRVLAGEKERQYMRRPQVIIIIIIIIINPLTATVVGAPPMILQPVFSIFLCSPLPSGTCRNLGLSIP